MFLNEIEIKKVSPCVAEPDKVWVKARFSDDVSSIMPYFNSVFKNTSYNPGFPSITLNMDFRVIAVYPEKMTIIKALNTTDAFQVIDWLQEKINDIYNRRDEIEPDYNRSTRPHPMQVFNLLPGNDCEECGEKTCMAFAFKLLSGKQRLVRCTPLQKREQKEARKILKELIPEELDSLDLNN